MISLTTEVGRGAKQLCEMCQSLAAQVANSEPRRQVNEATRSTMTAISEMLQRATDCSMEGRQRTLGHAQNVSGRINRLVWRVTSDHQFTGQTARITEEAREA
ncbi:unnamed protein product [Protopolystoma xenopodis]|uniref:Vinculin n=1 Tax=Protopolystoma xenopodis TaxID=117903 RepID=A0A448WK60_9PLAT|nr:unnamed protein product [Protopolystoma xenopodis]